MKRLVRKVERAIELTEYIRREIEQSDSQSISFYRFMELSLYHPKWGYYSRPKKRFGKTGDFFTNAQVGTLFGKILGKKFAHIRSQYLNSEKWAIIEMGAGEGQIMSGLISYFHENGIGPVDFYVVEHNIDQLKTGQVKKVHSLSDIPPYPFAILYSNELVDAFPVYRVQKRSGKLHEIHIRWDSQKSKFQEILHEELTPELTAWASEYEAKLMEGQICEINLDAQQWLKEITAWLNQGYLLTIDYGGETEENLIRREGTLRYFQKHRLVSNHDFLPGQVDMTSNVDFRLLRTWGEELGFKTDFYGTQTSFLLSIDFAPLVTTFQSQKEFKQLFHPDGMGEMFKVLVQKKLTSFEEK